MRAVAPAIQEHQRLRIVEAGGGLAPARAPHVSPLAHAEWAPREARGVEADVRIALAPGLDADEAPAHAGAVPGAHAPVNRSARGSRRDVVGDAVERPTLRLFVDP